MRKIGRLFATAAAIALCTAGTAFAGGQSQTVKSGDVPTLSWYYFGFDAGPGTAEVIEKMNEYIVPRIGARIEMVPLDWEPFLTQTNVKLAANEPYDIVFNPIWIDFLDGISRNKYKDITELFPKYAPKTHALLGTASLSGAFNGVQYAVPTLKEIAESYGILFNKQVLDRLGLSVANVKKIEDIVLLLTAVAQRAPDILPFDASGLQLTRLVELDYILGDDTIPIVTNVDGTNVMFATEVPAYVNALKVTQQLFKSGVISADAVVMDQARMKTLKQEGKVFATVSGLIPGMGASQSNDKVTWVQVDITKPKVSNKSMRGSMNGISSTSRNAEKALAFLDLMNTDKYLNNLWAFGIEGKHYTKLSENVIQRIPNSGFSHDWQWAFANQFLNYLKHDEDPNKWNNIAAFNDKAVRVKSLGFDLDLSKHANAVQAIKLAYSEAGLAFKDVPVEQSIQELHRRVNAAGGQELIAYVQAEYTKFLSRKK